MFLKYPIIIPTGLLYKQKSLCKPHSSQKTLWVYCTPVSWGYLERILMELFFDPMDKNFNQLDKNSINLNWLQPPSYTRHSVCIMVCVKSDAKCRVLNRKSCTEITIFVGSLCLVYFLLLAVHKFKKRHYRQTNYLWTATQHSLIAVRQWRFSMAAHEVPIKHTFSLK